MFRMLIITWKEIRDNLRDKRSLFFAFIYGPLLLPAMIMAPLVINAGKHFDNYDYGRELYVFGVDRAPNLLAYLKSKNLDAKPVGDDFEDQIRDGDIKLVIEISENYGEKFSKGSPAKVTIHYDKEDQESQSYFWQIRAELDSYSRTLAAQRMVVRGFDQNLLRPLDIAENDISEEELTAGILANMLMFLVVFSSMMGGFYLAIDITAGERERLSLEPLLSLPLSRTQVAFGKYLAVLVFCMTAYILPIINVAIWAKFLPDRFFGLADIPGTLTYVKIAILVFPVCILLSSFLMMISSFSKSNKEAQTQMGIAMLFPMAPFFVLQFMDIDVDQITMSIPILSQYLLADKIMFDAAYPLSSMLPGAFTSILVGIGFLAMSIFLYRQDRILGN